MGASFLIERVMAEHLFDLFQAVAVALVTLYGKEWLYKRKLSPKLKGWNSERRNGSNST